MRLLQSPLQLLALWRLLIGHMRDRLLAIPLAEEATVLLLKNYPGFTIIKRTHRSFRTMTEPYALR
jgi:hypothetical protein